MTQAYRSPVAGYVTHREHLVAIQIVGMSALRNKAVWLAT